MESNKRRRRGGEEDPWQDDENQSRHLHESNSCFSTNIGELPTDVILKIFYKLPSSIANPVCKEWHQLLSDSNFSKNHAKNTPYTTLWHFGKDDHRNPRIFLQEISKTDSGSIRRSLMPRNPIKLYHSHEQIIGSCCGLVFVLLRKFYYLDFGIDWYPKKTVDGIYVSNPITGRTIAALQPIEIQHKRFKWIRHVNLSVSNPSIHYRFGSGQTTKHYKVLRSFRGQSCIFTIGVDKWWRSIHLQYHRTGLQGFDDSVSCNGAIHWIILHEKSYWICAFDVDKEKCDRISYPKNLSKGMNLMLLDNDVLGLYEARSYDNSSVTLWIMKEYGVADSWTKHIILKSQFPSQVHSYWFNLVSMLRRMAQNSRSIHFPITNPRPISHRFCDYRSYNLSKERIWCSL